MKFAIAKKELQDALSVVIAGVATNSTLPVMAGIYVNAENDEVSFESTDLDFSCHVSVGAAVEEAGQTVLPGKLFFDIVKNLEDARVSVSADDQKAFITCDQTAFSTNVLNPSEFPKFPKIETTEGIEFELSKFQTMIKRVSKTVAKDESKGVFTGVFLRLKDSSVSAIASDAIRVSIALEKTDAAKDKEFDAILPIHFLNEICSIADAGQQIFIGKNENQIVIKVDNATFINRRLAGDFPDFDKLINANNETTVVVNRHSFVSAIKRVSILKSDTTPVYINVDAEKQVMQVSLNADSGEVATEVVQAKCFGDSGTIAFDGANLMDGLTAAGTNDILFTFSSGPVPAHVAPCIVNADEATFDEVKETDDNMMKNKYLYLLMPISQRK